MFKSLFFSKEQRKRERGAGEWHPKNMMQYLQWSIFYFDYTNQCDKVMIEFYSELKHISNELCHICRWHQHHAGILIINCGPWFSHSMFVINIFSWALILTILLQVIKPSNREKIGELPIKSLYFRMITACDALANW